MQAYEKLKKKFERIYRISHMANVGYWDEATQMPTGGADARAQAMAELRIIQQELLTSQETKEEIAAAKLELASGSIWDQANLREIERRFVLSNCISPDFLMKSTLAISKCEMAWRTLRAENNWKDFLPLFDEVVKYSQEGAQLAGDALKLPVYDSMVASNANAGLTSKAIERIFNELRTFLPEYIQKAQANQKPCRKPSGKYPTAQQKELSLEVMKPIGFDFNRGRLDVSHHPFCGGNPEDVRITTRYNEADFTSALMGTIHETGHANYVQHYVPQFYEQPVSMDPGMAIHESQSLFFEMQLARSREFIEFLQPLIVKHLSGCGDSQEFFTTENLHRLFTRVEPGLIRVDADEVTYPAHVILRFEIEKPLMEGKIEAKDIPELWNQKMKTYLGLNTEGDYKNGCMQDMHWPGGAFGYFPSYTFGALIAAQLFASLEKSRPQVRDEIRRGDFAGIRQWLKEKIWHQGCLYHTEELVEFATGEPLNVGYFKRHIESRYLS